MQVEVVNIQGAKTGRSVELPEDIFGEIGRASCRERV